MSNMKRSMRRVFWLLALCFFLLLGYLGKLVFVDREEISGTAYNSRLRRHSGQRGRGHRDQHKAGGWHLQERISARTDGGTYYRLQQCRENRR